MKNRMRPYRLKAVLFLLAVVGPCMLNAGEPPASKEFVINGPLYKRIMLLKDIVADILPPPGYIIESHLVVHELIDALEKGADAKTIDELIEYGRKLKEGSSAKGEFAGYFERLEFWQKDLPTDAAPMQDLRTWMLDKAQTAAKKYYEVRDTKFVPLLKSADPSKPADANAAKAVLRNDLKPLYEQHRVAIDEVVTRSNVEIKRLEREVVTLVAKGDYTNVSIGGSYYLNIVRMKDLISDVLPPPRYIIESHMVNLMLIDALERGAAPEVAKLSEWGRQLKEGMSMKKELPGYMERQNFWKANLAEKTDAEKKIKDLMLRATFDPSVKFFEVRDTQFASAIQKNDAATAKKVFRDTLVPLYREHRKAIDELVTAANASYEALMQEVAAKTKK